MKNIVINSIKNHKFFSFLALGGAAMATGLIHNSANPLGMAIGAFAIGNLIHAQNKDNGVFQPKIIKNAFIAVGSLAALSTAQHFNLPCKDVISFSLQSIAAYGVVATLASVFDRKTGTENAKNIENKSMFNLGIPSFITRSVENVINKAGKIRKQAEKIEPEMNSEFKPLNMK